VLPNTVVKKTALSFVLLCANLLLAQNSANRASSRPLNGFGLRDATPVYLKTAHDLSSTATKRGDILVLRVQAEVRISGVLLIAENAKATATVTEVQTRGRMGRGGRLNVRIDSVELVNGEKVHLRAIKTLDGSRKGELAELMGLSLIDWEGFLYWPILPFLRGNEVDLPAGSLVVAYVNANHPLKMSEFQRPLLQVSSTPDEASVDIDGQAVGSTPLTRLVAIGEHKVRITAPAREPWDRQLTIAGGAITISAELKELPPELP
jgi:hypothetical protein